MATVQAALEALQSRQDQVAIEIAKSEKQVGVQLSRFSKRHRFIA